MSENSRANLEVCWLNAEKASSEHEQRAWLEMAAAWRLLIAIGDAPSASEHRVALERSSPLADRLINISRLRQQVICQLRTYVSKCRVLTPVNIGTLSTCSFIQMITSARRSADRMAEKVRAFFSR